eukprot:Sspe_Gene.104246::Locus_80248_Transcript_1_1_Confidence_1.000_Length_1444::g.104246::m.104246
MASCCLCKSCTLRNMEELLGSPFCEAPPERLCRDVSREPSGCNEGVDGSGGADPGSGLLWNGRDFTVPELPSDITTDMVGEDVMKAPQVPPPLPPSLPMKYRD